MTIEITSYNPTWPQIFEEEAGRLKDALGDNCIQVHHVGSTSIPGLVAKPVIDIIVVVQSRGGVVPKFEGAGYISRGELNIPGRLYFKKSSPLDTHLHVYEEGHGEIDLNLTFRDYLRTHPKSVEEYASLKRDLIARPESHEKKGSHFVGYTLGKNAFIKSILEKAGFKGLTIHQVTHAEEWQEYHRIRREQICEPLGIVYDENHPSILSKDHYNFVLYAGTQIVTVAFVQFLNEEAAVLRSLATDPPFQKQGYAAQMIRFLEKWIKEHGRNIIHMHANRRAANFYRALGYVEMPFDDVSIEKDVIDLGKRL